MNANESMKTSRMERARKHYGVPAKRGGRILFHHNGREGRITSVTGGQRLRILFDGDKKPQPLHPTWKVEYLHANTKDQTP